jgi:hypothetical protein
MLGYERLSTLPGAIWAPSTDVFGSLAPTPRAIGASRGEASPPTARPGRMSAAEVFGQLFPAGVRMTGEMLADLEQWARLTGKLASHGTPDA